MHDVGYAEIEAQIEICKGRPFSRQCARTRGQDEGLCAGHSPRGGRTVVHNWL